jgi:hypothetical protein
VPARRLLPGRDQSLVVGHEAELVDHLVDEELGVPHVLRLHPPHHLASDHLDVLVVDVDALQPVDLLDLVHQVSLQLLLSLHAQDVVGVDRAVHERLSGAHALPFLDADVGSARKLGLPRLLVVAGDEDLAVRLGHIAVPHHPVDLRNDRGLFRPTPSNSSSPLIGHPGTAGSASAVSPRRYTVRLSGSLARETPTTSAERTSTSQTTCVSGLISLARLLIDRDAVGNQLSSSVETGLINLFAHCGPYTIAASTVTRPPLDRSSWSARVTIRSVCSPPAMPVTCHRSLSFVRGTM